MCTLINIGSSIIIQRIPLVQLHKDKLALLSEENKELEISFSQKNSLKYLQDNLEELGYEKVARVEYIRVVDTSMAAK